MGFSPSLLLPQPSHALKSLHTVHRGFFSPTPTTLSPLFGVNQGGFGGSASKPDFGGSSPSFWCVCGECFHHLCCFPHCLGGLFCKKKNSFPPKKPHFSPKKSHFFPKKALPNTDPRCSKHPHPPRNHNSARDTIFPPLQTPPGDFCLPRNPQISLPWINIIPGQKIFLFLPYFLNFFFNLLVLFPSQEKRWEQRKQHNVPGAKEIAEEETGEVFLLGVVLQSCLSESFWHFSCPSIASFPQAGVNSHLIV